MQQVCAAVLVFFRLQVNASQGNTSYDSPGIFQQTHITEESENHNESVPILQGPVDIGLLPQRGAKVSLLSISLSIIYF